MLKHRKHLLNLLNADRVQLRVKVNLLNKDDGAEYFDTRSDVTFIASLAWPHKDPEEMGFRVSYIRVAPEVENGSFSIYLDVTVFDVQALKDAATERYCECWATSDYFPGTAGEALYEVLYASNAMPCSPVDAGFELVMWEAAPIRGSLLDKKTVAL